jgi:hypothetical protein
MSAMRAKVKCVKVESFEGYENLEFAAVCRTNGYPVDGTDEDNTFANFSPSAKFNICVANPALLGKFRPGEKYYVDFTPAES